MLGSLLIPMLYFFLPLAVQSLFIAFDLLAFAIEFFYIVSLRIFASRRDLAISLL